MKSTIRNAWATLSLAVLAVFAVFAGCGGGGVGSGGTGAPTVSYGTVSGFGSVIVDGARFDDVNARTEIEEAYGSAALAEAKLGQRVEIEQQRDGIASVVRIEPELRGRVTAVGAASLTVLGQTVRVNSDPLAGPVTQFGAGYASFADVQVDHIVEVHGVAVLQGGSYAIQATRIDRRLLLPVLRVAGIVTQLSGTRFVIGNLTIETNGAVVVPLTSSLAAGQRVVVFSRPANLSGTVLTADAVRIKPRVDGPVEATLGGVIAGLDTATTSFNLAGVTVRASGATMQPALPLANGQYVQVRGRFAADGSLNATRVKIRGTPDEPDVELLGTIQGFNGAMQRFQVRDVDVDASAATLQDCPGSGLGDGLFVEVRGARSAAGVVVADRVRCQSGEPSGSVIERRGVASAVDVAARTFTLTPEGGGAPVTVDWTALTFFRDVTPDTLAGQTVGAEGVLANGRLVALRVRLRN